MEELSAAEVRRTGRGEWVGDAWVGVARGVWRSRDAADEVRAELRAWQRVLAPAWVFTHLTAARLRGWWLPPLPHDLPVFVAAPRGTGRVRRPGLVAIRRSAAPEPEGLDGLRVDPAAEVLAACARDLSLLDLLCLVESALAAGDCTLDDVRAVAARGGKGAPRLRAACRMARGDAESVWEVLLRELHRCAGAEVVAQHEVLDDQGRFLARADLWLVGTRTIHEYDGGDHLDVGQQRRDLRRARGLANEGWTRRGYAAQDVLHRGVRVLADIDVALGRPHVPGRIRAWHELLRDSLFTPSGTARLRARWTSDSSPRHARRPSGSGHSEWCERPLNPSG
ncbi:hypothetical protein [Nocardioides solisilvae]|uniref:hypothetical protein n=1 Tax=Nocardioides solisilvae TaxID=1542435 RepID=UPI000D745996|nr:hypothetical protein [Nocardioides solisilvae]